MNSIVFSFVYIDCSGIFAKQFVLLLPCKATSMTFDADFCFHFSCLLTVFVSDLEWCTICFYVRIRTGFLIQSLHLYSTTESEKYFVDWLDLVRFRVSKTSLVHSLQSVCVCLPSCIYVGIYAHDLFLYFVYSWCKVLQILLRNYWWMAC